ncbi:MAG: hypothetical protein H6579_00650 [Chitinophagales bacterium]|nr:hypothetical protein [Bacteroidota bacterium]MCB9255617.1 hypothetical protein [Chitinophagales bacterium]
MKNLKHIFVLVLLLSLTFGLSAQTGGPGPAPTGAPIDGLSGILLMAAAAIFGKKLKDKK